MWDRTEIWAAKQTAITRIAVSMYRGLNHRISRFFFQQDPTQTRYFVYCTGLIVILTWLQIIVQNLCRVVKLVNNRSAKAGVLWGISNLLKFGLKMLIICIKIPPYALAICINRSPRSQKWIPLLFIHEQFSRSAVRALYLLSPYSHYANYFWLLP